MRGIQQGSFYPSNEVFGMQLAFTAYVADNTNIAKLSLGCRARRVDYPDDTTNLNDEAHLVPLTGQSPV